ncbi:MAG: flippase [Patescibacteria group bacterium]
MRTTTHILKNTSSLTLALVIQKIIAFAYFTLLAHALGVEKLGLYVFVISFATMFGLVVDFGTNHYITREVAKNKSKAQDLFSLVIGFKLLSAALAVLLALVIAYMLQYEPSVMMVIYIALPVMVIESLALTLYAVLRGFQKLTYEAISTVLVHSIILIAGYAVAYTVGSVALLLVVLLVGHGANVLYALFILRSRYNIVLRATILPKKWKKLLPVVLPFALAAGFAKVYGAFDQIMLSKLSEAVYLGWYAVAYKLTFAMQFIPMAFMAALYPVFSARHKKDKEYVQRLYAASIGLLVYIGLPLSVLTVFFAPNIIFLVYGDTYSGAILPLQILIASLPFLFINFPIGSLLNATDHQKKQTINIGIALFINIILNSLFIIHFDAIGAALASTLSTVFLSLLGLFVIRRTLSISMRKQLSEIHHVIAPLLALFAMIFLLRAFNIHWVYQLALGIVVYMFIFYHSAFGKSIVSIMKQK